MKKMIVLFVSSVTLGLSASETVGAPERIGRRAKSPSVQFKVEEDVDSVKNASRSRSLDENSWRKLVEQAERNLMEAGQHPIQQRKCNAYYSDSPSLYGFGRGFVTVLTMPGNIVWSTYDVMGRPDSGWWVLATPIFGISGVFFCVSDTILGAVDMLSFGIAGDEYYLESGERPWIYDWLSEPAPFDKMLESCNL